MVIPPVSNISRSALAEASSPNGAVGLRDGEVMLLESKLAIPVQRPGSMSRAGLVNRLRVTRVAPVVHINAPAGYGKTTAVAEWSRKDGRPFAWYGADEVDDAEAFVRHLATAVCRVVGADETAIRERRPDEAIAL